MNDQIISVENLRFAYPKSADETLKSLSFSIRRGEIFGFLGPSGAGKSTTQKILIGLLKSFSGQVDCLGRSVNAWKSDYYERIGVSFELPNHYLKMTARENLNYFRALYAGEVENAEAVLESVGLLEDADKRVGAFSKGMKNRLTLARALLNKPELFFLDEPTAGLDPATARTIKNLIRQKRQDGATVFLTTHDMSAADQLCDRVAFIVDGEIKLIDSPEALKLRYGRRSVKIEFEQKNGVWKKEFPLQEIGGNEAFLKILREEKIRTIHTQESTLENIFIEVTGKSLR